MEVKLLKSYTEFEFAELSGYERDMIDPVVRKKFVMARQKGNEDSFYLLSDIASYIAKKRKDISYAFVVNKEEVHSSEFDEKIYNYSIYFTNITMPFIENLNGKIEISTKYLEKDIQKLIYLFDIIKMFYSMHENDKFLIVSDLKTDELDNLHFKNYEIMPEKEVKKMSLFLPIIEGTNKKVLFFGAIVSLVTAIIFIINIYMTSYIKDRNVKEVEIFKELTIKKNKLIEKNKKLRNAIKETSRYTKENIYKVNKND